VIVLSWIVTFRPAAQTPVSFAPAETNPWMTMLSASARMPGTLVSPVPDYVIGAPGVPPTVMINGASRSLR
jgi:hypothetical protein